MKRAHTVALIAALYLVSNSPAYSQDVFSFIQNMAGKYAITWSDLESRKTEVETQVTNALTGGKISAAQANDFRTELTRITTEINTQKASGRRLGITQSVNFSNQVNLVANNLALAIQNKVTTVVDVDALQASLTTQIDTALQAGQISAAMAGELKADMQQVATMEAAYKADSGNNLTPRQMELLTEKLNTVKGKVDQQVKIAQSAAPALNEKRTTIDAKIQQGLTAGRISAAEAATWRTELAAIASQQAGTLTGSQVLQLAQRLDIVDDQVSARIVGLPSTTTTTPAIGSGAQAVVALTNRRTALEAKITQGLGAGRIAANEGTIWNGELAAIAQMQQSLAMGGGGVLTDQQAVQLSQRLDAVDNVVAPRVIGLPPITVPAATTPAATVPASTVGASTVELDTLRQLITSRINQMTTSGRLSTQGSARFTSELDRIAELQHAFQAAAGGITIAQVDRLRGDLNNLSLKLDQRLISGGRSGRGNWGGNAGDDGDGTNAGAGGTTTAAINLPVIAQKSFSDVRGFWGEPYVLELASREVIGGFPNGSFGPNDDITREQFAAIVVKALRLSPSTGGKVFVDVPSTRWSSGAIAAASNAGLIGGFPDGTFKPGDNITRAQALVILSKALGAKANAAGNGMNLYSDSAAVPSWAQTSIQQAANAKIIVSFPDASKIRPNETATRGDVAGLMYQTLNALGANLPPLRIGVVNGNM